MINSYIKVCPNCGSTNVEREITPSSALGVRNPFHCNNCNFEGELFPEIPKEKQNKFKKLLKK